MQHDVLMRTTSIVCVGKDHHQRYYYFSSAEHMQMQGARGVCALRALVFYCHSTYDVITIVSWANTHSWVSAL